MKNKKLIIISGIVLTAIIITILVIVLVNKKQENINKSIFGVVKNANNGLVEVKTTEDDLINVITDKNISNGDMVEVTYYEIGGDKVPSLEVIASNQELNTVTTKATTTVVYKKTTAPKKTTTTVVIDKDEYIINYVKDIYNNIKNSDSLDKLKNGIISIVDFIFYDKSINGITFKELKDTTKEKVLYYTLIVDNKIDELFPNYKEKISSKYKDLKNQVVTEYLNMIVALCDTNKDKCAEIKEDFQVVKNKASITWNNIKAVLITTGNKSINYISNWYKIWSGKE